MERRSFLTRVFGGIVAAVALPFLLTPKRFACGHLWQPASLFSGHGDASRKCLECMYREGVLSFHPDAFALTMAPIELDPTKNAEIEFTPYNPDGSLAVYDQEHGVWVRRGYSRVSRKDS